MSVSSPDDAGLGHRNERCVAHSEDAEMLDVLLDFVTDLPITLNDVLEPHGDLYKRWLEAHGEDTAWMGEE